MHILDEANEVCRAAEASLRGLMQRAIEAGEYRHLPALARMAEQMSTLSARMAHPAADLTRPSKGGEAGRSGQPHSRRGRAAATSTRAKMTTRTVTVVKPAGHGYPKFLRDGETLIKIGWSKNSRTEYEHRAPRRVVDSFLKAVLGITEPGKVFTVESLLPLPDPTDATAIPGYQVYLVLAWFRTEGFLQQHGRDGYSLFPTINLEKTIDERWAALPFRKGDN